jgi:hypothetical protein
MPMAASGRLVLLPVTRSLPETVSINDLTEPTTGMMNGFCNGVLTFLLALCIFFSVFSLAFVMESFCLLL